ncbi:hypothetical protein B0H19DRAFT_1083021 [Mycena capillaripes]|nr:hypothetical protein B0H19DRAFT_1083021 [Mycena capillaripes]
MVLVFNLCLLVLSGRLPLFWCLLKLPEVSVILCCPGYWLPTVRISYSPLAVEFPFSLSRSDRWLTFPIEFWCHRLLLKLFAACFSTVGSMVGETNFCAALVAALHIP